MKQKSHNIKFFFLVAIAVFVMGTIIFWSKYVSAQDKEVLRNQAKQLLSEELGVSVSVLEIRGEKVDHIESIGEYLYTFFIIKREAVDNRISDRSYYVTLNLEGQRVNRDEMVAQDLAIKKAKYGKLEPALFNLLQTLGPDETIKVTIWMMFEVEVRQSPTEEEITTKGWDVIEAEDKERRRRNAEGIKQFAEPIVRDIEAMGGEITYIDKLTATISARLTRDQIEIIAQREDIRKISGPSPGKAVPHLDISAKAVRAPYAWNSGYIGNNQLIAIIEGGGVDIENPNLNGENRLDSCLSVDNYHATMVAGVAASVHNTYKGIAHGATLEGGEACTYDLEAGIKPANDWAVGKGAKVLNNSWGKNTDQYSDSYSEDYDKLVRTERTTVVVAAGNCNNSWGSSCTGNCDVNSPGIAYNVLTVGGYDDHNTETWSDDTLYTCSSYIDPFQGPSKPELVAPAKNIKTTSHYYNFGEYLTPEDGVSGTSFAAPHVAATAALMMERNSSLKTHPEAVKAILMASAVHNIEEDSSFSDRDGAGALSIEQALKVAGQSYPNKWVTRTVYKADFWSGDKFKEIRFPFDVSIGQRVRWVLVWSVNETNVNYPNQPGVRISSHLYDPDDYQLGGDYCFFPSNFCLNEFIAYEAGTYNIVVSSDWFTDTSTNLAIAWSVSGTEGMQANYDTDRDGMYDNFENAYGLNPNSPWDDPDVDKDPDHDGLTNLTEYHMGTNPALYDAIYSDVPLQSGITFVKAQHIYELRDAVNGVRESAGLSPISGWSSPSWTDPDLSGAFIKKVHIQELRDYLTPALQARDLPIPSWTPSVLTGKVIKAAHLNQIRNAVK